MINLILTFLLGSFILSLGSVLVLCKNWKYYKVIYKTLPTRKFRRVCDIWLELDAPLEKESLTWFPTTKDVCLRRGVYLHESYFTYLDPYSFYWLKKYQRWFKDNLKTEENL